MAVFEAQVAKAACRNSLPNKERLDFDTTWDSTVIPVIRTIGALLALY